MKRRMQRGFLVIALVLMAAMLAGCGALSSGAAGKTDVGAVTAQGNATGEGLTSEETMAPSAQAETETKTATRADGVKLIYTAEMTMETTEFGDTEKKLRGLVEECGGYFESSSVRNGGSGYRYGSYVIRVPSDQFSRLCTQAEGLCNVTYQSSYTEDVSEDYYDTQGRLGTQKTKLGRLQALMEKADTMEEIVALEETISQTEEQIESLSGTLKRYDSQVNYATVDITLDEVYQLSNVGEPTVGFGSRFIAALGDGGRTFVHFLQGAAMVIAYSWVWILLAAAVVLLVLWLNGRGKKRREKPGESLADEKKK